MLGDSTWTELFPRRFVREYPFLGFNIFDLDSVDRGINKSLPNELARNDWSLLVAHYLGVDHCGHKHGPQHPEMARKLNEMNGVIEQIVASMADDTTLFVVGDHGMSVTGDHGGDTEDEVNALLFAFSKSYGFLGNSGRTTMDQIDLVPSLAAILGIPIPFSNLGATNFDIVPNVPTHHLSATHTRLLHSWSNVKQMRHYFSNYTAANRDTFSDETLDDFFMKFYVLSMRVATLHNKAAIDNFNQDVKLYLQEILSHCRSVWVKFDDNLMFKGLIFTAVVNFFLYLLITNLKFAQLEVIFSYGNLTFIYLSNAVLGAGTYILYRLLGWEGALQNALVYMTVYSILLIAFLLIQNWDYIALNWSQQKHFSNLFTRTIFGVSIVTFFSNSFIIHEQKIMCYLISGALLIFLYKIRNQYKRLASWHKVKTELILSSSFTKLATATFVVVALMRASYSFHLCREEQGNCIDSKLDGVYLTAQQAPTKAVRTNMVDLLPILSLALFATFSREFLRKCGNLSGFSAHVLLARYGIVVAAVGCCGHFIMSLMKHTKSTKSIQQIRIDAMAWIVYAVFVLQLCTLLARPLMLFVLPNPNRSFNVSPFGRVVPQIVMKMKQMYENGLYNEPTEDDIPVVYGLATVYSSVMWTTAAVFVFTYAILIGPLAANGIFIVVAVAALVLILNSILRYQRCTRLGEFQNIIIYISNIERTTDFLSFTDFCLQPEFIAMVIWYMIGHYSFYATSHQATLSQIEWHAAFVGRTAMHDHNNTISAILILINTFGGQFLIFCMYPLLVMTPTALYTIFPSLAPRRTTKIVIKNQNGTKQREIVKKIVDRFEHSTVNVTKYNGLDAENDDMDVPRGELTLYENEDIFIGSVFKAGCQLLILQGIRVSVDVDRHRFVIASLLATSLISLNFRYLPQCWPAPFTVAI